MGFAHGRLHLYSDSIYLYFVQKAHYVPTVNGEMRWELDMVDSSVMTKQLTRKIETTAQHDKTKQNNRERANSRLDLNHVLCIQHVYIPWNNLYFLVRKDLFIF